MIFTDPSRPLEHMRYVKALTAFGFASSLPLAANRSN
jgi:hypothetical protein